MAGGGYYPIMMDWEWSNAPWNEVDAVYETCPKCKGDGFIYVNEDGVVIRKYDYEQLNDCEKSCWDCDKCEKCDGIGTIEKYE